MLHRCSLKTNKSAKCDHCIWNIKAAGQQVDNVNQTQAAVTTQVRPDTTQNLSHEVLCFLVVFKPPPRFLASCCFRSLPDSCFHTFTLTTPHAGAHLLNGRVLALSPGWQLLYAVRVPPPSYTDVMLHHSLTLKSVLSSLCRVQHQPHPGRCWVSCMNARELSQKGRAGSTLQSLPREPVALLMTSPSLQTA